VGVSGEVIQRSGFKGSSGYGRITDTGSHLSAAEGDDAESGLTSLCSA
jgi:hypothetical protein